MTRAHTRAGAELQLTLVTLGVVLTDRLVAEQVHQRACWHVYTRLGSGGGGGWEERVWDGRSAENAASLADTKMSHATHSTTTTGSESKDHKDNNIIPLLQSLSLAASR